MVSISRCKGYLRRDMPLFQLFCEPPNVGFHGSEHLQYLRLGLQRCIPCHSQYHIFRTVGGSRIGTAAVQGSSDLSQINECERRDLFVVAIQKIFPL
jgi:hypothetical protein